MKVDTEARKGFLTWALLLVLLGLLAAPALAEEGEPVKVAEVVVTATRTEEEVERLAANVTVITEEEIKDSTATTVPELLEQKAGILVRDLYGNGTKTTVDMRGFARGVNTVIMIDGRRLNEVDLSGVDWNLVPLENVERIEIVRGSGSVLYGDNAMAGVINIITKRGVGEKPEFEAAASVEPYDGHSEYLSARGVYRRLGYYVFGKLRETDGYRENSEFRGKDLSASFDIDVAENVYADIRAGYHRDHQGLPGGLTEDDMEDDRRGTNTPEDGVDYDQHFLGATVGYAPAKWAEFEVAYDFGSRAFDADISSWGGSIVRDTDTHELKLKATVKGAGNVLVAGIDRIHSQADNTSDFSGFKVVSDVEKTEWGLYANDEHTLFGKLVLSAGYRYSDAEFDDTVSGDMEGAGTQDFNESAVKAGAAYNYAEGAKVFAGYSRGYRLPTTDELFAFDGTIVELDPERADTFELGAEHPFGKVLKAGLTLYYMKVKDELFFDPATYTNQNLDRTLHRGAELSLSSKPLDRLSLSGTWTYTRATFEAGENEGKAVPLVPEHQASLSAVYRYWRLRLSAVANWVGSRFLENDLDNSEEKLDDYTTMDLKLTYLHKYGEVFVGVDNLFDAEYEAYGVVGFSDNEFYPAPDRRYYAGVKFTL